MREERLIGTAEAASLMKTIIDHMGTSTTLWEGRNLICFTGGKEGHSHHSCPSLEYDNVVACYSKTSAFLGEPGALVVLIIVNIVEVHGVVISGSG
ncbi:unnamed protein product [Caretta caretta]